jgi:hypothetical protein
MHGVHEAGGSRISRLERRVISTAIEITRSCLSVSARNPPGKATH